MGRLELIIGPMYAGKSTELLRIVNRYKCLGKNVLAINHCLNKRYGGSSKEITTHDNKKLNGCLDMELLASLFEDKYRQKFEEADVIIIEELQFFTDAFNVVKRCIDEYDKILICAGLDGDYKREPFGDILYLIPYAEKVTKLTALCKRCGDGTLAAFTKRYTKNNSKVLVGGTESYEAVCRKHYLE